MKSRTSFFDKTVLRKDLTRFSPLWALYLIGGLLIMHLVSGFFGSYFSGRENAIAKALNNMIGPLGLLSAGYGFLAAQLLFGDLHNTRLCYGVHSLPLRREKLYLTHIASGLLMGLVPPMVIVLTLMPMMGKFWFTGLLCWAGMALHFLFFFGLAVFSMMSTGNRFAATAVYGILNLLSLIIRWFANTIYIPLLPGVRANTSVFNLFCPAVELVGRQDYFRVEHLITCEACKYQMPDFYAEIYGDKHDYAFTGLGDDWGYLLILAGAGLILLVSALLLYRIRHLERAGDFMAFKPMKPIFLTVYTLCVGALLFVFGEAFGDEFTGYLFFVIGIFIGYFTGKMMLERTIRVFKGKSWAGLGILYGAVILSLLLTWIDPIGISRRIPKPEKVEAVYLHDGYLSDYQINRFGQLPDRGEFIAVTDPEDIATVCDAHQLMLQEHETDPENSRYFTLRYEMKNGTFFTRTYYIHAYGEARQMLRPHLTKPSYLFNVSSLDTLTQLTQYAYSSELGEIPKELQPELLKAMWQDAQEGHLSINSTISGNNLMYIELRIGTGNYRALYFTENAPQLQAWMKKYQHSPQILLQCNSVEELLDKVNTVYCPAYDMELSVKQCEEFLKLLWQDTVNGHVTYPGKWSEGLYIEIELDQYHSSVCLSPACESAHWLLNNQK